MTVTVLMLQSPFCHACKATKPLIEIIKLDPLYSMVEWRHCDVAKGEALYRTMDDIEKLFLDFLNEKASIPIDDDDTLSDEEREEYRSQGIEELASLPTFIVYNTDRPLRYEVFAGGIAEESGYAEREQFIKDFKKWLNHWIARVGLTGNYTVGRMAALY